MNGPEHYREAERLVGVSKMHATTDENREIALARAQVHATLALAAATALHPREALTTEFRDQVAKPWVEAAG